MDFSSSLDIIIMLLSLLGLYAGALWAFDNFKSIVQVSVSLMRPFFQPNEKKSLADRFGKWAVITGATDGIGKQYALELARQHINICLISRSKDKLIHVANEIQTRFPVKTHWIEADFSKGDEIYKHIETELKGIPVGILINNVGRMYDYPDEFGNVPEKLLSDLLNINMRSVTMMTRMVINDMKKIRKGAIINISSGSELQPLPYTCLYGASKVFVRNLTLALQQEYSKYGLVIQLVTPMFVSTKMNEYSSTVMRGNILIPNAEQYTKSALFTLGKTSRTTGYWSHGIQYGIFKMVPEWIRTIIGGRMNLKFRKEHDQQLLLKSANM